MSVNTKKPTISKTRIVKLKSYTRVKTKSKTNLADISPSPSSESLGRVTNQKTRPNIIKSSPEYLNHLIRKLFFPHLDCTTYHDILPSLTSSNKIDLYLYPFLGLLIRNFINRWYERITDDQEFVNELITTVSSITRKLETKLKKVDLIELLLDDLPLIFEEHLKTYRKIHSELGSTFLPFDTINSAFDHLQNHRALTNDPKEEYYYLKILSNMIVQKLLPDKDSTLVLTFVNDLLGDMLLKQIIEKISQPYQMFEILTKICEIIVDEDEKTENPYVEVVHEPISVKAKKVLSSLSHFIAYTTSINSIEKQSPTIVSSLHVFTFLDNFFQIHTYRPVLYSTLCSLARLLKNSYANHFSINLITNTFIKMLGSEDLFCKIFEVARENMFPQDDIMGAPRIEPDLQELEAIRKTTKESLRKVLIKYSYLTKFLICDDLTLELDDILEDFLTSFEKRRLNKHLAYRILDLVILRLFPEFSV
ncbi:hypothetical protein WICMUC_002459 [Wickerhamomyces mucosus]|uniref:PXA domain-containing protein n=1 Tax=Wickerhamomyces mucosus TaxID=1378264 RepID=A0A9P8TEJ0_9ASCO|nr:hypothetical protein WICMUC_002459 [Wickerhamomyces mucosus]